MAWSSARVVLVETSKSKNIGSVARAMNNLGFDHLCLVNCADHLDEKSRALASNSNNILEKATSYSSLKDAIADCNDVYALSARERRFHQTIYSSYDLHKLEITDSDKTAFGFGRESSGLTNEEISICNRRLKIPTYGTSGSLNLAQAVMVTLYEFRKSIENEITPLEKKNEEKKIKKKKIEKATSGDLEGMKNHLYQLLDDLAYRNEERDRFIQVSISDMVHRANLSAKDVRILRGFLMRIRRSLKDKNSETPIL